MAWEAGDKVFHFEEAAEAASSEEEGVVGFRVDDFCAGDFEEGAWLGGRRRGETFGVVYQHLGGFSVCLFV